MFKPFRFSDRTFLLDANLVVVANELNASLFSQLFFIKNGILREEDFVAGLMITPPAVVIPTTHFRLTIIPDRIQAQVTNDLSNGQPAATVVSKILQTLPHTPFTAVGFNFNVFVSPPKGMPFQEWNREFLSPRMSTVLAPQHANPLFGSYFSFDAGNFRVKVDLKPAPTSQFSGLPGLPLTGLDQAMMANFNFHRDLKSDESLDVPLACLSSWKESFAVVQDLATSLSPE